MYRFFTTAIFGSIAFIFFGLSALIFKSTSLGSDVASLVSEVCGKFNRFPLSLLKKITELSEGLEEGSSISNTITHYCKLINKLTRIIIALGILFIIFSILELCKII